MSACPFLADEHRDGAWWRGWRLLFIGHQGGNLIDAADLFNQWPWCFRVPVGCIFALFFPVLINSLAFSSRRRERQGCPSMAIELSVTVPLSDEFADKPHNRISRSSTPLDPAMPSRFQLTEFFSVSLLPSHVPPSWSKCFVRDASFEFYSLNRQQCTSCTLLLEPAISRASSLRSIARLVSEITILIDKYGQQLDFLFYQQASVENAIPEPIHTSESFHVVV